MHSGTSFWLLLTMGLLHGHCGMVELEDSSGGCPHACAAVPAARWLHEWSLWKNRWGPGEEGARAVLGTHAPVRPHGKWPHDATFSSNLPKNS